MAALKFGVIIPTRGDRPRLLEHCLRMIDRQTLNPDFMVVVDDPPESDECDITKRYRKGYDVLRNKRLDVIFLVEDDDWYSPTYFETMLKEWEKAGKPELFGTDYTTYYHLKLFAHFTMEHYQRSSAMSTMIKPDMDFDWPPDYEPFTDTWLWMVAKHPNGERLQQVLFHPEKYICLGIKHGTGKTGGNSHVNRLHRYTNPDPGKTFLKSVVDPESFEFYSNYFPAQV